MLNERIERFSEIADVEGLFFVWKNLVSGVSSIKTLMSLRSHHSGKLCLNINASLYLLEDMGYLSIEESHISNFSGSSFIDSDSFALWLSPLLIEYFLKEKIISLDYISYDRNSDKFVLARKSIKYKYAAYRNLLISFHILSRREDGNFYIENAYDLLKKIAPKHQRKISEEKLLKQLEQQREEGQAGENFVLCYELKRLEGHPNIEKVKQISTIDVAAGYDIVSYNSIHSSVIDRFIEVKTYKGKPHFHWSTNEMQVAKITNTHYYLYLVDYLKINDENYIPTIIKDPIIYFKDNNNWDVTPDSYLFELLGDDKMLSLDGCKYDI